MTQPTGIDLGVGIGPRAAAGARPPGASLAPASPSARAAGTPGPVDVLTFRNDLASTGLNPDEAQLAPATVRVGIFGKLFTTPVDGQVYAQPLVKTAVALTAGPAAGMTRDVVFVATQGNSIYAIDVTDPAGSALGSILWRRSFLDNTNPNNRLPGVPSGGETIASVPFQELTPNPDITPVIGITGTPVIDPSTATLYVVAKTKETVGAVVHYVQRLHALSLADGSDRVAPFLIGDTTGDNINNTPIYAYGNGDGHVTDPYNGTGRPVVQFNARREHQRAALALVDGTLYIPWASHGDNGPYHGWVVAWDVSNLAARGFQLKGVFNTTPNGGLSGIWMGGGRLVFEPDGSAFYFVTGNGPTAHAAPTVLPNGLTADGNYYEAVVKVVADPATTPASQNPNGWGLKAADFFIPYSQVALDNADQDFGSGGPLLLPDSAGIPGHPRLLIVAGKEGKIYLLDRDNLGKFDPSNDHVLNAVPDGAGHLTPPKLIGGSLSTPAFFDGRVYWVGGYTSNARSFAIGADGTVSATSQTSKASFGGLPGSPSVSASGTTGGIVWVMDRDANQIHAYDASSFALELWNSGQKAGNADAPGVVVKFATPTVANGKVFVGTANSLVAYGSTPPPTAVPGAPTNLRAVVLSGTSVNLAWDDATAPPNTASGYDVELSTDGTNFTPATTAAGGARAIALGGLTSGTTYEFRVRGFNGLGNSAYSNVASATTSPVLPLLDFGGGFAGAAGSLTFNGSAAVNGTKLELTNGGLNQAGSAFATHPVEIGRFSTRFTFQLTAGANTADGFTFAVQGVGPTALGASGGGLGYGPDHPGGPAGIARSVAVKFDLFSNAGETPNSTGLFTNGASPTNPGSIDLNPSGLNLHGGHVLEADLNYDGTTLSVVLTDTQSGASAIQQYRVNIPAIVGGTSAFVGFTGGTGGLTATQDILTWTFAPGAALAPAAPSGLGGVPASASSITLTWTNNATDQTGYQLDRANDAGFTQGLSTFPLPAVPARYTDAAPGLAPGDAVFYRLRATNTAGPSANSNTAQVTIPPLPATPSGAAVTGVTTTSLDLTWTDNAGRAADGYRVSRRTGVGMFETHATLPALNRTPPSPYTYTDDVNVAPGTAYEYHIIAFNVSGNNDFAGTNAATLTLPPLNLTAHAGNGSVALSWTLPAGAVRYNVYRGTTSGGEAAAPIAHGLTTPSFTDAGRTNGTTYFYQVTAVNSNTSHVPPLPSEGARSAEASATPHA